MQALSISTDKVILKYNTISVLVRNIACLLQNRFDESIDAERQKSDDLARLINNYERAVEKAIMDEVTDSIDKMKYLSFLTISSLQQSCQEKKLRRKIKSSRKIS